MNYTKYILILLCGAFMALMPLRALATLTFTYQSVPSSGTILEADDTFTVTVAVNNDGSVIRGMNLRPEIEPSDLAFITNITMLPGPSQSYSDIDTGRLFTYYGAGGTAAGTIQVAQVTFKVTQCPDDTQGTLKINPFSVAVSGGICGGNPVCEYTNMVEQRFNLTFKKKTCAPPTTPTPTPVDGVGDGSYETTNFEVNPSSSTGIAGCAVGSNTIDSKQGVVIALLYIALTLTLLALRRKPVPLRFKRRARRLLPLLLLGLWTTVAEARIYHVDNTHPSACNGATCVGDQNNPFDSIAEAFSGRLFEPGDQVLIHDGTYNESVEVTVNNNGNGRLGLPILIRGESNTGTIINGGTSPGLILKFLISYWSVENLQFQNGGPATVSPGVTTNPTSLLLYLVGKQINVVDNIFSGTVSGTTGKSALQLITSSGSNHAPTSIQEGHLVKHNQVVNMGLSSLGSAAIDLSNFNYSYAQNNLVSHNNAATGPQVAMRVFSGDHAMIERNALLNRASPSSIGVGSLAISNPTNMGINNNIILASSAPGGSGENFMGSILMLGSGSAGSINRVHHNSIIHTTDAPVVGEARRTAILVHEYAGNYSDWVNNIMTSLNGADHPHFLWTGSSFSGLAADTTKRIFIAYNSITNRFFTDLPGPVVADPLGADRMNPNSLHDIVNNAADYSNDVCKDIGNTLGLPACKRRENVAYAGSATGAPFYNFDIPFDYFAALPAPMPQTVQNYTENNQHFAGSHFPAAAGNPFGVGDPYTAPAIYNVSPAVGANGQNRCSDVYANTNVSCDAVSGHLGGPASERYGSRYTVSICSSNPAKQLDVFPSVNEPDRRLTVSDYVTLIDTLGDGARADKVGNYLVTMDPNYLSCI